MARTPFNPGQAGWIAVGVVVALADGYALRTRRQTMSDVFHDHAGWGVFVGFGTLAHLVLHKRLN